MQILVMTCTQQCEVKPPRAGQVPLILETEGEKDEIERGAEGEGEERSRGGKDEIERGGGEERRGEAPRAVPSVGNLLICSLHLNFSSSPSSSSSSASCSGALGGGGRCRVGGKRGVEAGGH